MTSRCGIALLMGLGVACSGPATDEHPPGIDADDDGHAARLDCDDSDPAIHPGAEERCNGIDDDCDGRIDTIDNDLVDGLWLYWDGDGDGWGVGTLLETCTPQGYAEQPGDCDDEAARVHPGATETWYDGVDQDCDYASDYDQDADRHDSDAHGGRDCDDTDPERNPSALERPNAIDDDCDGAVDDEACHDGIDNDGDALVDCEDADCFEPCQETAACEDGIDNDDDGWIDNADPDCWGNHPPIYTISRVRGGRLGVAVHGAGGGAKTSGKMFTSTVTYRHNAGTMSSVWGSVQAMPDHDEPVLATCQWTLHSGSFSAWSHWDSAGDCTPGGAAVWRGQLELDYGCGALGTSILPPHLWAGDAGVMGHSTPGSMACFGYGLPWYTGATTAHDAWKHAGYTMSFGSERDMILTPEGSVWP